MHFLWHAYAKEWHMPMFGCICLSLNLVAQIVGYWGILSVERKSLILTTKITWRDCLNAMDELINTIKIKMINEPEHGEFWQQHLSCQLLKRQEILAKIEEEEQSENFM
jgi:hypothetical protein